MAAPCAIEISLELIANWVFIENSNQNSIRPNAYHAIPITATTSS